MLILGGTIGKVGQVDRGEIAISDERAAEPELHDLARLVTDAHVGGMLSRKAGVTHFHVGDGEKRLELIRRLLSETDVQPEWLYLTHVERNEPLMKEAVEITGKGCFRRYRRRGGRPGEMAALLFRQRRRCYAGVL